MLDKIKTENGKFSIGIGAVVLILVALAFTSWNTDAEQTRAIDSINNRYELHVLDGNEREQVLKDDMQVFKDDFKEFQADLKSDMKTMLRIFLKRMDKLEDKIDAK
jgi:uncharacterized membrane protein YhiD involved in acid resistance